MKVRQLLGWTRPATPTDMADLGSSNNRDHHHYDEDEGPPFEPDMGKLSIDDLTTPEPGAPRAGNNNCPKEMEASTHSVSRIPHRSTCVATNRVLCGQSKHEDGPEEPEDKASTIFSPACSAPRRRDSTSDLPMR